MGLMSKLGSGYIGLRLLAATLSTSLTYQTVTLPAIAAQERSSNEQVTKSNNSNNNRIAGNRYEFELDRYAVSVRFTNEGIIAKDTSF